MAFSRGKLRQGMGGESQPGTMMGLHGPPGQGMWVPEEVPAKPLSHSSEGEEEEEPSSEENSPHSRHEQLSPVF